MSAPNWFYAENENRLGPVPVEQIAHLIMSGGLDRVALVWRHGMPDWTAAGGVPEIASLLPPPLPPAKPAKTKSAKAPADKPTADKPPAPKTKADDIADLPTLQGAPGVLRSVADALAERSSPPEKPPVEGAKVSWPGGRLADHEFAELVHEVHGRRWTGLLTLNHMGVER